MTLYSTITKLYYMSQAKSKIIQFRVTEQDFMTLYRLAEYLYSNGQAQSANCIYSAKSILSPLLICQATTPLNQRVETASVLVA
jgi:hypothetical protein